MQCALLIARNSCPELYPFSLGTTRIFIICVCMIVCTCVFDCVHFCVFDVCTYVVHVLWCLCACVCLYDSFCELMLCMCVCVCVCTIVCRCVYNCVNLCVCDCELILWTWVCVFVPQKCKAIARAVPRAFCDKPVSLRSVRHS